MEKEITNSEEKKILEFLKNNSKNYPNVMDISKAVNLSYPTTLKRIEILERLGYIEIITVGNNKICRLK